MLVRELVKVAPHVALGEVVLGLPVVAEEACAERTVGEDGDLELLAGGEDAVLLDVGRERRVLDFDGGDGSNGGSLADGLGRDPANGGWSTKERLRAGAGR